MKSLIYNDIEDKLELENVLNSFNISEHSKFAVVILKIDKHQNNNEIEIIENRINSMLDSIDNILRIYLYPNEFIALVNEEKYEKLRSIYKDNFGNYKDVLYGGVGKLKSLYDTHISYQEARIALKYSGERGGVITYIDSLKLELILEGVDMEIKKLYVDKVLNNVDEQDLKLLYIYYKNNMSLKQLLKSCLSTKTPYNIG